MTHKFGTQRAGVALAALCVFGAASAEAHDVVFVSGKGADTGACTSHAHPCRTFQFAVDQAVAGGEVKALDPADYGPVTITKSITIEGVDGAGINLGAHPDAGEAITVQAGPNDAVTLTNLTLQGDNTGKGVHYSSGASLTITYCKILGFGNSQAGDGILIQPTIDLVHPTPSGQTRFLIADTLVANGFRGITIVPGLGPHPTQGTLDHVSVHKNFATGVLLAANDFISQDADVTIINSLATNNGVGFEADQGTLRIGHSTATQNQTDVQGSFHSDVSSFGDNHVVTVTVPGFGGRTQ